MLLDREGFLLATASQGCGELAGLAKGLLPGQGLEYLFYLSRQDQFIELGEP